VSRKPRPQPRARAEVVNLPRRKPIAAGRFLPSSRSVAIGVILAALAACAYLGARETSVFAVRTVQVEGVSPALAQQVQKALQPLEGTSLLKLTADDVSSLATALPDVASVSYDRAFPNMLRVRVELEQPLAVLRHASDSWLISRRARVMHKIPRGSFDALPRVWIPEVVPVALGSVLVPGGGAAEVEALRPVRTAGLSARVLTVRIEREQIAYVLRGGLELRVGSLEDISLKLAVARDIMRRTALTGYLDVSVPARPVAGHNPQVSGGG
jgi:cell division protein FtsQ